MTAFDRDMGDRDEAGGGDAGRRTRRLGMALSILVVGSLAAVGSFVSVSGAMGDADSVMSTSHQYEPERATVIISKPLASAAGAFQPREAAVDLVTYESSEGPCLDAVFASGEADRLGSIGGCDERLGKEAADSTLFQVQGTIRLSTTGPELFVVLGRTACASCEVTYYDNSRVLVNTMSSEHFYVDVVPLDAVSSSVDSQRSRLESESDSAEMLRRGGPATHVEVGQPGSAGSERVEFGF